MSAWWCDDDDEGELGGCVTSNRIFYDGAAFVADHERSWSHRRPAAVTESSRGEWSSTVVAARRSEASEGATLQTESPSSAAELSFTPGD